MSVTDHLFESDKPGEECGVFGIYSKKPIEAANLTYLGLYALQHRGQESAGIAVTDGSRIRIEKGLGLVQSVFNDQNLEPLRGHAAIGHVRYSTTGVPHLANAQPLLAFGNRGPITVAHNGNLTNTAELRQELLAQGSVFQTTTDAEVVLNLISRYPIGDFEEAVAKAAYQMKGAFSIVVMSTEKLIGFRDPRGIRPLCVGKVNGAYVIASESCALNTIGATFIRDVEPGEMVIIDEDGLRAEHVFPPSPKAFCVFEYIYFARPDSDVEGRNVHLVRKAIGKRLAEQSGVEADVVIAAPDSGTSAAMGFAEAAGIPFEIGIIKNRYIGRTFIEPTTAMRSLGVKIKLNPIRSVLEGKRVILVDDSIVRGTTSKKTVQMLREAGAKEVHLRIAAPPFTHPCHYGIDVPGPEHLIATGRTTEEICDVIGADSLQYVSVDALHSAIGVTPEDVCSACFTGQYPTKVPDELVTFDHLEERGVKV